MSLGYRYETGLSGVDWREMKTRLAADDFDNGRSPHELQRSFESSFASVIAYADGRIVGTARALSDGVCNAYVVDVWTFTPHRHRGVASAMLKSLEARLDGQHMALFSHDAAAFYKTLGYAEEQVGLSKVIGTWLRRQA